LSQYDNGGQHPAQTPKNGVHLTWKAQVFEGGQLQSNLPDVADSCGPAVWWRLGEGGLDWVPPDPRLIFGILQNIG